jgi:hypothetical protein
MATELGQAYVQIMPSAKGIQGSITEQLSPEATSAGTSAGSLIGGKMVGALAGIIAAAKIGQMITDGIKASFNEGAALQQSMGGVETLFKNNAGIVKKYADEAEAKGEKTSHSILVKSNALRGGELQVLEREIEKVKSLPAMS